MAKFEIQPELKRRLVFILDNIIASDLKQVDAPASASVHFDTAIYALAELIDMPDLYTREGEEEYREKLTAVFTAEDRQTVA